MTDNKDETLLNPEKPLTMDMAQRFMEKYAHYYEIKRNLKTEGKIITPNRSVSPVQLASGRE